MKLAHTILLLVAFIWSSYGEAQQLSEMQQQPQQQLPYKQLSHQQLAQQQLPNQQLLAYIRDSAPHETAIYGMFLVATINPVISFLSFFIFLPDVSLLGLENV